MEPLGNFKKNFTVRINLKTFCHYSFKGCHDYFKGCQDFFRDCQDFFKDTKKSYCQDFCTSPNLLIIFGNKYCQPIKTIEFSTVIFTPFADGSK